ncbi:A disintegrin and metalloproteinase with thrombospondin motifs 9-like [Haliotis asinina]|uniref:A disintegrin and metalloproteinase with thrombospondin motifs 9-like n=1 Tax=Haliotis asinina TaxID=109174 RepID=UPI003531C419
MVMVQSLATDVLESVKMVPFVIKLLPVLTVLATIHLPPKSVLLRSFNINVTGTFFKMQLDRTFIKSMFVAACISTTYSFKEFNYRKTGSGAPAVLDDPQHLQVQEVFGPTTCAILCSRLSCKEFQYSDTSHLCITRHSDAVSGNSVNPGSGFFDTFIDNKEDPKTCSEIKKENPAAHSGEYTIVPSAPQFRGMSVKVFCLMNDTHQLEYVTLPNENVGSYPKRSNGGCGHEVLYLPAAAVGKDGVTVYQKIRIIPSTMTVVRDDTTFTTGTKAEPHPFGRAEDCYSYKGNCKRIGTFHIDTQGTGMKFARGLRWTGDGYASKVDSVTRTHDGAVIDLVCGGWCAGCVPMEDMVLYPNSQDIQS